ncbi:MAG: formylglycine-generating enzyme family protein [Tepidisphaeraceae bacterium]|jgi:formylglycine-generating enzyme required for sulfatase activity
MNKISWAAALIVVFAITGWTRAAESAPPATQSDVKVTTRPSQTLMLDLGNNVRMKLILIPVGKFIMGSPIDEKDRMREEGPQREVTLARAFYMGIHHVTQEQYEAVMGQNPSCFKGPQHPVEQVSWDHAAEFCRKLSGRTGKVVRLPTEAEWEYACRAGSNTRFSFGDDDSRLGDYAWYVGNSDKTTHPVGQKKPNAFGLHDMHGNVGAWCSDYYANSYANAEKIDPRGPASGTNHVLRGGCWGHDARFCRSAFRIGSSGSGSLYGFRVVVDMN